MEFSVIVSLTRSLDANHGPMITEVRCMISTAPFLVTYRWAVPWQAVKLSERTRELHFFVMNSHEITLAKNVFYIKIRNDGSGWSGYHHSIFSVCENQIRKILVFTRVSVSSVLVLFRLKGTLLYKYHSALPSVLVELKEQGNSRFEGCCCTKRTFFEILEESHVFPGLVESLFS